jgi:hypothetical protein
VITTGVKEVMKAMIGLACTSIFLSVSVGMNLSVDVMIVI